MSDHKYVSTACQHDLHKECRRECKFCGERCLCQCHRNAKERNDYDLAERNEQDDAGGPPGPIRVAPGALSG